MVYNVNFFDAVFPLYTMIPGYDINMQSNKLSSHKLFDGNHGNWWLVIRAMVKFYQAQCITVLQKEPAFVDCCAALNMLKHKANFTAVH